jgi:hypothetical protein
VSEAECRKKELLVVVLRLPLLVMEAPFLKAPFLLRLLLVLEAHGDVCWWSSHGTKLVRILFGELDFFAITPQRCFELLFCLLGIPRFLKHFPIFFCSGFLCLALPSPT